MSCGEKHETPCSEVLNSVVLLIDGEIEESSIIQSIENHLQECPPCKAEMEHERRMHSLLHEMLTRSCMEQAPKELHDHLVAQIRAFNNGFSDMVTEYRKTEISIQIEDFGQIEHHEITIESSQEFRLPREFE